MQISLSLIFPPHVVMIVDSNVFKESTADVVTASARVDVYSYFSYAHGKYSKNFESGFRDEKKSGCAGACWQFLQPLISIIIAQF
jgi:hypothetical protein